MRDRERQSDRLRQRGMGIEIERDIQRDRKIGIYKDYFEQRNSDKRKSI